MNHTQASGAVELNYQLRGSGPTVLLMHGLFGNLNNLSSLARKLEPSYQVLQIDLRNHGRSPHTDSVTYALMVADISRLLAHLDIDQCYVLGHSMGGKVAMAFAMADPGRVKGLVVVDIAPVAYGAERHKAVFAALDAVNLKTISQRSDADAAMASELAEPGLRQFLLTNLYKRDDGFAWRLNLEGIKANYSTMSDGLVAGSYPGRCLFVKGEQSDYVTVDHKDAITSRFPAAAIKVIQGTGHWLHAEKPDAFNGIVERFLAQCENNKF